MTIYVSKYSKLSMLYIFLVLDSQTWFHVTVTLFCCPKSEGTHWYPQKVACVLGAAWISLPGSSPEH